MNPAWLNGNSRWLARFWGLLGLLYLGVTPVRADDAPLPPIQTVFIIVFENTDWLVLKGNPSAPYFNSLLPAAAHCEQYYNILGVYPSEPNYLWLECGTDFGMHSDAEPDLNHQSTTNHLVTQLKNASISWKTYQEDISGTVVPLMTSGGYAARHNPFVYFDDVTGTNNPNYAYGIAHIRPFTEIYGDLASNNIARYNFITPDVCHDMHDSCQPLTNNILQGDNWLSNNLPVILNSQAYKNGGAVFITFDEPGTSGYNAIPMIVLSPFARPGYGSTNVYSHSCTLRTMQEIFSVGPFLGAAATATNLSDLFTIPTNTNNPPPGFQITGFSASAKGTLQLTVNNAIPGKTNIVQSSSNLVQWAAISTNVPTTNYFSYSNAVSTNAGQSFYRVLQLP